MRHYIKWAAPRPGKCHFSTVSVLKPSHSPFLFFFFFFCLLFLSFFFLLSSSSLIIFFFLSGLRRVLALTTWDAMC